MLELYKTYIDSPVHFVSMQTKYLQCIINAYHDPSDINENPNNIVIKWNY